MNPVLSVGGEMHSISEVDRYFPWIVVSLNLHVMLPVSLKFDPIAITLVPPVTGPSLGLISKR